MMGARKRGWLAAVAVVIGAMAPTGVVEATGPGGSEAQIEVLCSQEDRVVMLYHEVGCTGGPRFNMIDWRIVMVDLATSEGQAHDMGWVVTEELVSPGEPGTVERWDSGDSVSIVESLARWEMAECHRGHDGIAATLDDLDARFEYGLNPRSLVVVLDGRSRRIEAVEFVLPGAVEVPERECWQLVVVRRMAAGQSSLDVDEVCAAEAARERQLDRPLQPLREVQDRHVFNHTDQIVVGRELRLESKVVLPLQVTQEYEEFPVLAVVDRDVMSREPSYLVYAKGFDVHREGDFATSAELYRLALYLDPGNHTAQYNWACALALQGEVGDAVQQLMKLERTVALRLKIEGDADFDGARDERVFREFMQGLPAE